MRHVGILAHSIEGAALCLRTIGVLGDEHLGAYEHPDVTLDCISMAQSMASWDAGEHETIRATLATSVQRLAAAGADFFVCPDNTAHLALEHPGDPLALPGLHIASVVADEAARSGYQQVGVLGTIYTMEGPLYPSALAARGLKSVVPPEPDRQRVNTIIFDELVRGLFREEARREYADIIARFADRGCDAVALVCTEIPLLIRPSDSPLPVLDSTRLLARAALDVGTGDAPMPTWRGGAVQSPQ